MTEPVTFTLAYPPSTNRLYIGEGKHKRLKPQVVDWRKTAQWAYKAAGGTRLEGPVRIEVELYKPAVNVPFDVDNSLQNILNALKGVAYDDDDQVYLLVVAKMWPDGRGKAVVRVQKIQRATPPAGVLTTA